MLGYNPNPLPFGHNSWTHVHLYF